MSTFYVQTAGNGRYGQVGYSYKVYKVVDSGYFAVVVAPGVKPYATDVFADQGEAVSEAHAVVKSLFAKSAP
jgi:hypothetical protein